MRIGFDFDNTIVSYDALFHQVAEEQKLIPSSLPKTKIAVRDYLRNSNKENTWTEMQGYVYGERMGDASPYPGVIEFIKFARDKGVSMVIVSHKTRHPFIGPKYNLHEAASGWIDTSLIDGEQKLFEKEQIFFELTKEEKVARIADCNCDYYIDDLPEILQMQGFPEKTGRILFDPEKNHTDSNMDAKFSSWNDIKTFYEEKW